MNTKSYKHFYITSELKNGIDEIAFLTGAKNYEVMTKAALYFLEKGEHINPQFLIKDKNDEDYVARGELWQVWVEGWIIDVANKVSKEINDCGYSVVLFQMLYDYIAICRKLLQLDE